jgi:Phosphoribosyl transferase (PRTase)/PELOTA RNA binding domain
VTAQPPLVVSSYALEEVSFLLTDVSSIKLELDLAERERAIQGGRNYAEMLPVEYSPGARYLHLFDAALAAGARSLAEQVGVVTEMILAARGPRAVLVSLARAGTPIGILLRRWARYAHGVDLPHYSVSIVRGVGIDTVALDHIAARHDPSSVMFVDGWTGKGAIVQELQGALKAYAGPVFSEDLAVIADPGECAAFFGTREDVLIPSACLNSTVCGLVSRTVYSRELVPQGTFHAAKVYRELAAEDRSADFLDAVCDQFGAVQEAVSQRWPQAYAGDRSVTFRGLREVERLRAEFGLPSIHLVKPGVGETTRVLMRRLPWQLLIHPDKRAYLAHLLLLAEQRLVPIVEHGDMAYSCVGLVRPLPGAGT